MYKDDLREILFEFAAEYGKALLKLPHMVLEWSENNRLVVGSKDRSVIRPRNFMLRFLFKTKEYDRMPEFEEMYPDFLNYKDREKFLEENPKKEI